MKYEDTWSFYDPESGHFMGRSFSGPTYYLDGHTPPGLRAIAGTYDHLSQRVDLVTGEVVDYQPPAPSPHHEWRPEYRRWHLRPSAVGSYAYEQEQQRRQEVER